MLTTFDAWHAPMCRSVRDTVTRQDARGDWVRECRTCASTALVVDAQAATDTPPPAITRGYVCRDHPEWPVNWRGHGCPECVRERNRRREAKRRTSTEHNPTQTDN